MPNKPSTGISWSMATSSFAQARRCIFADGNLDATAPRGSITVEMGASIVVNPTGNSPLMVRGASIPRTMTTQAAAAGYGTSGIVTGYYSGYGGSAWGSTTDVLVAQEAQAPRGSRLGRSGAAGRRACCGSSRPRASPSMARLQQTVKRAEARAAYGGRRWIRWRHPAGGPEEGHHRWIDFSDGWLGRLGSLLRRWRWRSGSHQDPAQRRQICIAGTISGTKTEGLIPPMSISSSSHPDQTLYYNDDSPGLSLAGPGVYGSSGLLLVGEHLQSNPPTPANGGKVTATEAVTAAVTDLREGGTNYFHIVPIDAMSSVGTIENIFRVNINNGAADDQLDQPPVVERLVREPGCLLCVVVPAGRQELQGRVLRAGPLW